MTLAADHLVYGALRLEEGIERIEQVLGVTADPGGRHPAFGTHNALLSLGPEVYLEILAPDPESSMPPEARRFGLDDLAQPRLITWVARTGDIGATVQKALELGIELGDVGSGRRESHDGAVLEWTLTDPHAEREAGVIPFLIDWGFTPHPGSTATPAGMLNRLLIEHPDPVRIGRIVTSLGLPAEVVAGPAPALIAHIHGPLGEVELR